MKNIWKRGILVLTIVLICVSNSVCTQAAESGISHVAYAKDKPKIDGEIDAIWDTTDKMYGDKINDMYGTLVDVENYEGTLLKSYAQILWDKEGLYLLGVVFDTTFSDNDTVASNSVEFWLSEKNSETMGYVAPGDWYCAVMANGTASLYTMEEVDVPKNMMVKVYEDKYVVEMHVPYQSDVKPKNKTVIGFNVSFNDDIDGDGVSDICTYWNVSGDSKVYWANTAALLEVRLVVPERTHIILCVVGVVSVLAVGSVMLFVLRIKVAKKVRKI